MSLPFPGIQKDILIPNRYPMVPTMEARLSIPFPHHQDFFLSLASYNGGEKGTKMK